MICPECDGEGYVEREGYNGPYEEPCGHCYGGLGLVPDEDSDE
jgi:DnaJ-class molecular chaperone